MRYSDIVPDYAEYKRLQTQDYQSFESEVARWRDPQVEGIKHLFSTCRRDLPILDCACGDGAGLRAFQELGFTNVTGVELCPTRACYELV